MDAAEQVLRALAQPAPLLAIQLHRGHLELAASLQAFEAGDEAGREQKLALATAKLALGDDIEVRSDDVRYARRVLQAAHQRYAAFRLHAIVATDGRWFQKVGGKRVDLTHRLPLQRLLCALISQRLHAPSEAVGVDELIRAGWPGEKSLAKAAKNRLHVAIATLRKSGLETHLVRITGGYRLERTLPWNAANGASSNPA